MLQALQSVGMLLLAASGQLLGHRPGPSGSGAASKEEMMKIHSMSVVKDSLAEHRTDRFRFDYPGEDSNSTWPGFAVRRGMAFNVSVQVNKELDLALQKFRVESIAHVPAFEVVRCVGIDVDANTEPGMYAYLVEVTTKVTDPAARYTDVTVSVGEGGDERFMYPYPFPIYVLYNPYHPQDEVYMPDSQFRKNYLEEEATLYFQGEVDAVDVDHWYYGQYDPVMLEAAFDLLEDYANHSLADPRQTVRSIAKGTGYWTEASPPQGNPRGILNGHWFDDNFTGGTNPDDWVSSLDIVNQWYENDKTPVNYGQCWVFAAVGRSMFAALGLVSRQVSGFGTTVDGSVTQYTDGLEAHAFPDGKSHHVVMFFFDVETGAMRFQWGMVWNFHSWSEVHFNSPHESGRWSGWHVVDPTLPGAGPAPVRAIQELAEGVKFEVTDMIGDLHSTLVYKLVKCPPAVDAHKLPANTSTCDVVKTTNVNARGAPLVMTSASWDSQSKMDITANYVNHSVDAFVPLPDGTKPYPEDMAEASLDPVGGAGALRAAAAPPGALQLSVRAVSKAVLATHTVRVNVEVQCAPQAEARTVEVMVAGDLLRVNSPKRLAALARHTAAVTLSQENNWRAAVPVTVDLAQLQARGAFRLGPFRHVVEFGTVAIDKATGDAQVERTVVLLKKPEAVVTAPERVAKAAAAAAATAAAAGRKMIPINAAAATARTRFESKVVSPFAEEVANACVTLSTLHHVKLGLEGRQCFATLRPGEAVDVTRDLALDGVPPGAYRVSFVVSAPEQPTAKFVHTLFVE